MRFKGEGAQPLFAERLHGVVARVAPTEALSAWSNGLRAGRDDERPTEEPAEPHEPFYLSADSAPAGYAVRRSAWVTPLFLAVLAGASMLVALAAGTLTRAYAEILGAFTGRAAQDLAPAGATISIRPFVLVLFVLLAVFAVGPMQRRVRLVLTAAAAYAVLTLGADVALTLARPLGAPAALTATGGIAAAAAALLVVVLVIFTQYAFPPGIRVPTVIGRAWSRPALFVAVLGLAVVTTAGFRFYQTRIPAPLDPALLAALVSSVVVLVVAIQLMLFVAGAARVRPVREAGETPSVAFLIPAFNEERWVGAVIAALDAAAARYDGDCRLYLVDNGSPDRTAQQARKALAASTALEGEVLSCPRRGKSHALNFGLEHTTEDIVIRVDADTLVPPTLLADVVPYFSRGDVGGVSGIPLPRRDTPRMLSALRSIEVFYSVTFLRTGQSAVDATLVMPGNMSAYRGDIVRNLGGFAVGFNGEDTDMAVRIGRLGYRIVTDPAIRFETEVPASVGHLMEQRRRWSRGVLYVAARNKSSITQRQGLRGILLLPWSALAACRRALTIPLLICVAMASVVDPAMLTLRQVAVVGGVIVGVHTLVVVALLVVRGRFDVLPFVPLYILFRLFKLYVAFDALLTLELKAPREQPVENLRPVFAAAV